jgi:hypothetical protein
MSVNSIDELESAMRKEGAMQALLELRMYLHYSYCRKEMPESYLGGLKWAIDATNERIKKLESEEVTA